MKNITLADIAAKTGFSINTVSHALHDKPDISQKTKDYIIKTANEIGYIANSSASSLRSGKTKSIAIICGDISNPYFSIMIREMEITLKNYGYTSFIINTDENQKIEKNAIISAISRGTDGIVLCPVQENNENIDFIKSKKMPYILIGRRFDESSSYVVCDDENGGKLAAMHLFDEGIKKILFLNGPSYISSASERLSGIEIAFREADIPLENLCTEEISITTEQTIEALLSKHSDCEAVICFSDLIAMQVCHCLKEAGKNVPQDISVIGFDNIASNFYFSPMLSSVTSSKRKMASFAIEALMKMIETDDLTPINKVFKTKLILRETTK
ncbi:MAG: LacI family DNA-binding transcriptional regulator [Clostridia bacterium]|nr:LacI family DNA-binding transcriptional regulator [Clostridia bacterium]